MLGGDAVPGRRARAGRTPRPPRRARTSRSRTSFRSRPHPQGRCTHLDRIVPVHPSAPGCEECLRSGDRWVHLRICLTCGHVGRCDTSKNKHAKAMSPQAGSPGIYSAWAIALGVGQVIAATLFLIHRDDRSARRLLRASLLYLICWMGLLLMVAV